MWDLHWNDLTAAEKERLRDEADFYVCRCCGHAGDAALNMFSTVVDIIKARDRAAAIATLGHLEPSP